MLAQFERTEPLDMFEKLYLKLVVALAALNGLDLLSTKVAIDHGASEGWWISEWLFDHNAMYQAKIAVVAYIAFWSLLLIAKKGLTQRKLYTAFFVTGFYSCVIVANVLTYVRKYS